MKKDDDCPKCGARLVLSGRPTRRGKKRQRYVCKGEPAHAFIPLDD